MEPVAHRKLEYQIPKAKTKSSDICSRNEKVAGVVIPLTISHTDIFLYWRATRPELKTLQRTADTLLEIVSTGSASHPNRPEPVLQIQLFTASIEQNLHGRILCN